MGVNQRVSDALSRLSQADREATQKEIAEAGKNLNQLDMKDVNEVGAPPPPKNPDATPKDVHKVDISADTMENIEAVSRVQANKEMQQMHYEMQKKQEMLEQERIEREVRLREADELEY